MGGLQIQHAEYLGKKPKRLLNNNLLWETGGFERVLFNMKHCGYSYSGRGKVSFSEAVIVLPFSLTGYSTSQQLTVIINRKSNKMLIFNTVYAG